MERKKNIMKHQSHVGMTTPINLEHPLKTIAAIAVSPEGMTAVKSSFEFEIAVQIEQLLQVRVLML